MSENPVPLDWQPARLLVEWASERPSAAFFSDGVTHVTFAEAAEFVNRVAQKMRELGVSSGQTVALEMPWGLQSVFTCAAMHEATASATFHAAAFSGSQPDIDWLFTTAREASPSVGQTVHVDSAFLASLPDVDASIEPQRYPTSEALCRIALSSGSTGTPKQVPLTVEMVWHRSHAALDLVEPGRPFMSLLDLSTASGFHTLIAGLLVGAGYLGPGDPEHNLTMIRSRGVAAIKASPTQVSLLLAEATRREVDLPSLATIYSAGGNIPVSLRTHVRDHTSARLINLYGSTEVGRGAERVINDDDLSYVGDVVEGTELTIVDDNDVEVPPGTVGNVRYRRAHMATHYRNSPEATTTAFRGGWFYTGDLGSLDQAGRLTLLGRIAGVMNAGGVKIDSTAIEAHVNGVSGVSESAGFVHTQPHGVGEFVLATVCRDDVDLVGLAHDLREAFGPTAPRQIFRLPALPRTPSGKVALAELADIYADALYRAAES